MIWYLMFCHLFSIFTPKNYFLFQYRLFLWIFPIFPYFFTDWLFTKPSFQKFNFFVDQIHFKNKLIKVTTAVKPKTPGYCFLSVLGIYGLIDWPDVSDLPASAKQWWCVQVLLRQTAAASPWRWSSGSQRLCCVGSAGWTESVCS